LLCRKPWVRRAQPDKRRGMRGRYRA